MALKQDDIKLLVESFFEKSLACFQFLESESDFRRIAGIVSYKLGRQVIRSYKPDNVPKDLSAVVRYEKGLKVFEIKFSSALMSLEANYYNNLTERLGWSDVLEASRQSIDEPFLNMQGSNLEQEIERLAHVLKNNMNLFLEMDDRLAGKAMLMRSKRTESNIREQHKRALDIASKLAAEAFTKKDYFSVVRFFAPFAKILPVSDKKKYRLARRKIAESSHFS